MVKRWGSYIWGSYIWGSYIWGSYTVIGVCLACFSAGGKVSTPRQYLALNEELSRLVSRVSSRWNAQFLDQIADEKIVTLRPRKWLD